MAVFTKLDAVAVLKKSTHRSRQALGTQETNQDNYKRDKERCQMNKLQISVKMNAGTITTNSEELKKMLTEKMAEYENVVFTEESKSIAKSELAELRRLKKDVDDRRKLVKSKFAEPYNAFEKEVKELLAIIDKPINEIDKQLKEMEVERIRKKRETVKMLYDEVVGDAAEYLPLDEIYDSKWDNAGTSMKKIREALEQLVVKTASELSIIQNSSSDVMNEALSIYKKSRDLSRALTHINTYEANKKKALELEEAKRKQEEERRREAELQRAREDERKHLEEISKIRQENENIKKEKESGFESDQFLLMDDDNLPFAQPATITAYYKVIATPSELEQVEMAFNSLGIWFERRDI